MSRNQLLGAGLLKFSWRDTPKTPFHVYQIVGRQVTNQSYMQSADGHVSYLINYDSK